MSPAEEKAAADQWVGRMKDMACRLSSMADTMPLQEEQRAFFARLTELQFAQIATIEAAIAGGMSIRSAAEITRSVAATATGLELVWLFGGDVPATAVEQRIGAFGTSVVHAISTVPAADGSAAPTIIEPTHSDHHTRQ
ncbi:hypothetical protein [Aureimonas sp. SK2]|uniref:hypothetical protein n=1 Tax=Aureimonas sp. SK2 TaxID=3015992 RepID=UPI0024441C66|nr:hypothetical protein [Aureimonas sp. SK2]